MTYTLYNSKGKANEAIKEAGMSAFLHAVNKNDHDMWKVTFFTTLEEYEDSKDLNSGEWHVKVIDLKRLWQANGNEGRWFEEKHVAQFFDFPVYVARRLLEENSDVRCEKDRSLRIYYMPLKDTLLHGDGTGDHMRGLHGTHSITKEDAHLVDWIDEVLSQAEDAPPRSYHHLKGSTRFLLLKLKERLS